MLIYRMYILELNNLKKNTGINTVIRHSLVLGRPQLILMLAYQGNRHLDPVREI